MSLLIPVLQGAKVLKPWMWLAQTRSERLQTWLAQSKFFHGFSGFWFFKKLENPAMQAIYQKGLLIGLIGLLLLLSFAETGLIGAAVGALLLYVIGGWLLFQPSIQKHLTIIDLLVVLFLGSAAISTAFSSWWFTSLIGLGKMLTFVAGYVVFRVLSEQGSRPLQSLLWVLVLLGLGETLVGFYQYQNHIQPLATWNDPSLNPELQMNRIFGTLKPSNPNLLAGFLVPCFASAAGLSWLFLKKKTWPLATMLLGLALAMLAALVLTGSRGGFLAIGVMGTCMFAYLGHLIWHEPKLSQIRYLKPLWLMILGASLLAITGGILSSEQLRHRVASIFAMRNDSSISYRLNVYTSAFHMFKDNWLVGIGPGNGTFKQVYGLYMVPGYNALGAYSVPLEIAVEQGIIGLFIFASLLVTLILRTMLCFDAPQWSIRQKLLAGLMLTGILGSFMYGMFDTIWYRPAVNLLFWLMVAALARLSEAPLPEQE